MITSSEKVVYSIESMSLNGKHYILVSGDSDKLDIFELKNGALQKDNAYLAKKFFLKNQLFECFNSSIHVDTDFVLFKIQA